MTVESVCLYYKDGGSDKEYNASIRQVGDGYMVEFSYGRRGSTLTAGSKTTVPVGLSEAKVVYDKLVQSKVSKGYTLEEGGTLFAGTENGLRQSGYTPMLLNPVTEEEVKKLLGDNNFCLQEKLDGRRLIAGKENGVVFGSNRKGLIIPLTVDLEKALSALPDNTVLDGEMVGDVYHVFDCLCFKGGGIKCINYSARVAYYMLTEGYPIKAVPIALGYIEKVNSFNRLKETNCEGVVFKLLTAHYVPGRPNSGGNHLKFKFKASATVQVLAINKSKRSVLVGVKDKDVLIEVGNVTILPNFDVPPVGTLVEAEYLYYFPGGSLFQPVYKGSRSDKYVPDNVESLKCKNVDLEELND